MHRRPFPCLHDVRSVPNLDIGIQKLYQLYIFALGVLTAATRGSADRPPASIDNQQKMLKDVKFVETDQLTKCLGLIKSTREADPYSIRIRSRAVTDLFRHKSIFLKDYSVNVATALENYSCNDANLQ